MNLLVLILRCRDRNMPLSMDALGWDRSGKTYSRLEACKSRILMACNMSDDRSLGMLRSLRSRMTQIEVCLSW